MDDLIKAFQIFRKYSDEESPTHCEHDALMVCAVDPADVSAENIEALDKLGFDIGGKYGGDYFQSFRFGSC